MTLDAETIAMIDDPENTQKLYARTNYVLRESRKALLRKYAVSDEAALLEKIRAGEVEEHPAYDHYLGALIIEQTRLMVRADMLTQLGSSSAEATAPVCVHLLLKEQVEAHYAQRLTEPVQMVHDALLLSFDSGLLVEVRFFSPCEYMLSWRWGEAEMRIDTAPTHPQCPTFPHHLHGEDGVVRADPVTRPGADCQTNLFRLLDALLDHPLLDLALPEPPPVGH